MGSLLHPALWGALIVGLLFAAVFVAAAAVDMRSARADRQEHVLATFVGLRLTSSHLLVGNRKSPRRIPLAGLSASAEETEFDTGRGVVVTVHGAGPAIQYRQPATYGARGEAQIFTILLGRMSGALQPVAVSDAA